MNQDKALLKYGRKEEQWEYCWRLLSKFCDRVAISRAPSQSIHTSTHHWIIEDKVESQGPLTGIYSAFLADPFSAWFVLACDFPLMDENILSLLRSSRKPARQATILKRNDANIIEPLCSIYEPSILPLLKDKVSKGQQSPRFLLEESDCEIIELDSVHHDMALFNSNTPEEYETVIEFLSMQVK